MKKKIMYFVIPILFFMGMFEVNAAEATCVYSVNDTVKLKCEVDENAVSCKFAGASDTTSKYMSANNQSLTPVNFQSNKKWKCRSEIYAYISKTGTPSSPGVVYELLASQTEKTDRSFALIASESSDGGDVSSESPIGDSDSLNCQYGKLILTYNKKKNTLTHNSPCTRTVLHFDADDLGTCPDKVWAYSHSSGSTCNYYLTKQNTGGWISLNSNDPIPDADGDDQSGNTTTTPSSNGKTEGCAILGGTNSKTVELLSWVVKVIRLGVPILIIILGMTDFLKILFSGEDKVFKDAFAKFAKRLMIGVCIIFIPYIIQLLIRISGVDSQYGIDNFFCGIIDATSGVSGTEDIEVGDYTDSRSCYKGGYIWNDVKDICVLGNGNTISVSDCTASGNSYQGSSSEPGGWKCVRKSNSDITSPIECSNYGYTWTGDSSRPTGGYCANK